ncbi:diguanylate cyclase [Burkholderia sp. WAC0059]|uniref:putative bifunctional diguanylate cyclase/phosphodiesterase n=1 Tax=Burkholderia sp. WAC0059 TaxID=2066022 RepID=UPI000C7F29BF|nr:GGDEF domain-containing protein [Burkholderia sp. WAC0059]PLZ04388.1 diguanylate cyclase [Burkholderia sp. WAC0059]
MEANRMTALRPRRLRKALDRLYALVRRDDDAREGPANAANDAADAGPRGTRFAQNAAGAALETTAGAVDFFVHVDERLRFLYVSDASLRFAGYPRAYLRDATLRDLVAAADLPRLDALLERAAASSRTEKATVDLVRSLTYPLTVELRVLRAPYAGVDGYAVAGFDVSDRQATEARLTHALHHDPLTALPNQAALASALARMQADADASGLPAALLVLDIDSYQRVNRALGYDAGDEMLRETARRITNLAQQGELIAHAGSDEFAILIAPRAGVDAQTLQAEAETLGRRLLTAVLEPYLFCEQPVHLSASIGIALYPDARHAADNAARNGNASPVLRWADQALQRAKASGGNTLALHVPDDDPADAERLKLESDLYDGVRNGEFSLHFQPITSSQTHGVVGVEALMRWQHPVHGLVPPSTFIPLAESVGLINYLGNWVLKAACMQLAKWDEQGISLQYIAVNVSPQQFRNPHFKDSVYEAIELTGVDPGRLVFEITESLLMHDPVHARALLEDLTALGIGFAIDDFGTGYSSLAYLQRFPLSKLKIDRSFVENLLTSRNDQAIVNAVVGLARTLELELVAEGVETEAQRELLTKMGCDHIQGWLVCKALPSEELAQRFESRALYLHREAA